MTLTTISFTAFEALLPLVDWTFEADPLNATINPDDRTSLHYVADCYLALPDHYRLVARRLIHNRLPKDWIGWPVVVNGARRRRKAFRHALDIGILSDNPKAENYHGHYFYSHSAQGKYYFRHRQTFKSIESPFSKGEVRKFELRRPCGRVSA